MRVILPLVLTLLLAGCGLKDDLYLPESASSSDTGDPSSSSRNNPREDQDHEDDRAQNA